MLVKPRTWQIKPNLVDYNQTRAEFSWDAARAGLDGLPGGALNIAHEAVDRHAAGARRDHVAIRWLGRRGERRDLTFGDLRDLTGRFANVLSSLGVTQRERVFVLSGRIPELYIAALGALKHGSVFCPLFSAFGPEPIRQPLKLGDGRVLVTTPTLYRRKVAQIRESLPGLRHVLLATAAGEEAPPGTLDLPKLMQDASPDFETARTRPEDMELLHFTSGTTGTPKGAVHVHEALVAHHATRAFALDLHPEDVFWCTADPGWVTGTSYGMISPLTHGVTSVVDEADFDAERWYHILAEEHVSVWYTAPTAMRMMMKLGAEVARSYSPPDLRFIASVGEPLNLEAVRWGVEAFGMPVHDNWSQTETGGIMIANFLATDVRPGSMGRPLPGIEAAVLRRDSRERLIVRGGVALRAGRGRWASLGCVPAGLPCSAAT